MEGNDDFSERGDGGMDYRHEIKHFISPGDAAGIRASGIIRGDGGNAGFPGNGQ